MVISITVMIFDQNPPQLWLRIRWQRCGTHYAGKSDFISFFHHRDFSQFPSFLYGGDQVPVAMASHPSPAPVIPQENMGQVDDHLETF